MREAGCSALTSFIIRFLKGRETRYYFYVYRLRLWLRLDTAIVTPPHTGYPHAEVSGEA